MSKITVPVTGNLRAALQSAGEQLEWLDSHAYNDAKSYEQTAMELDQLAQAIMGATSSTSFLSTRKPSASFEFGPGSKVMDLTTVVIGYLTETAGPVLLRKSQLSMYSGEQTSDVRSLLAQLYRAVQYSVLDRAMDDLKVVYATSQERLLSLAEELAEAAAED